MSAYRKNNLEARMEVEKEKFFARYRRQTFRYALVALGFGFSFSLIFGGIYLAEHHTSACRDTSEVISYGSNNEHVCDANQRMDTTRLREGDNTYVLVRCWCGDHGQPMKEETP